MLLSYQSVSHQLCLYYITSFHLKFMFMFVFVQPFNMFLFLFSTIVKSVQFPLIKYRNGKREFFQSFFHQFSSIYPQYRVAKLVEDPFLKMKTIREVQGRATRPNREPPFEQNPLWRSCVHFCRTEGLAEGCVVGLGALHARGGMATRRAMRTTSSPAPFGGNDERERGRG